MKTVPVVVVLGHIDHGKSSLLETIKRDFKITEKESGGITQHIGAYEIEFEGRNITFIDTPGHEAFSEMRSRGAKVADIAILVVAVDEGVKIQTKEAVEIIKKAGIPMIIALNKVDKKEADLQKVKGELKKEGISIEEWGGDIPVVETSAKTGKGIKDLLSIINLVAEISEIKKNIETRSEGVVIESYLDSLRGPTATVILERGKIKVNDIIATNTTHGKIRKIFNFKMVSQEEISAGQSGVVMGLEEVPEVGGLFRSFDSLEEAQKYVNSLKEERKEVEKEETAREEEIEKFLKIVLRADVKGSLEVLQKILKKLKEDKIGIKILKNEVGEITDSDIKIAESENAKIIGFRVGPNITARSISQQKNIEILTFDVIYDIVDGVRKLMRRMIERRKEKVILGKIKPLIIFKSQKRGEKKYRQIVGGKVIEGEIKKASLEVERDETVLGGGKIIEIQEQKRTIDKARAPQEIGILYEGNIKIKQNDTLLVYEIKEI